LSEFIRAVVQTTIRIINPRSDLESKAPSVGCVRNCTEGAASNVLRARAQLSVAREQFTKPERNRGREVQRMRE
jgi:hypothetical protein